jgi:hypothetical protein
VSTQKKQSEKSNEKGHKRWTLWRHGTESDQDAEQHEVMSSGAVMSSYSQEFKMEQLQVMIDEVSTESPSNNSHSIVVAEWAAIRIQTAFRGFLVLVPGSTARLLVATSQPLRRLKPLRKYCSRQI